MKGKSFNCMSIGGKMKRFIFFILCFFLLQAVWGDVQDGLVSFYPFNGNANDESGFENNGSVNGASLRTDRFGNPDSAYNFSMGNYISTSIGPELSLQHFSVSLWVYNPDGTSTWNPRIIAIGPDYGRYFNIHLLKRYDQVPRYHIRCLWNDCNSNVDFRTLKDNAWHHICITFDGNDVTFYIDGIVDNIVDKSGVIPPQFTSSTLYIGNGPSKADPYTGGIDDIRIYNRGLTESEVLSLYNETPAMPVTAIPGTSIDARSLLQLDGSLSQGSENMIFSWQIQGETTPRNGKIVSVSDLAVGNYQATLTVFDGVFSDQKTMLFGVPESFSVPTPTPIPPDPSLVVITLSDPLPYIPVYLFNESGTYLNMSQQTDTAGQAAFDLDGGSYMFRADYQGNQYWSDPITPPEDTAAYIDLAIRCVIVQSSAPIPDIPVYVFNNSGTYLNMFDTTDGAGEVSFEMAQGSYIFRADYQGNQYYSNEIDTRGELTASIDFQIIEVTVNLSSALPDVPVYVFNSDDHYLNINGRTDQAGRVFFLMAGGNYWFRADYQGSEHRSPVITTPTETSTLIDIGSTTVTVQLSDALASVPVYVFNDQGTYLNINQATDDTGRVVFDLSTGSYQFRADYLKSKYWSNTIAIPGDTDAVINLNMAPIVVSLSDPVADVLVYVFTGSGSYIGLSGKTDSFGQVIFNLAEGSYTFRADYQKNKYWSSEISTPGITSAFIPLDIVRVTVSLNGQIEGIPVYVFNDGDTYLGMSDITDSTGRVFFDMAAGNYKFRADYDGSQYFSEVITTPGTSVVSIFLPGQTPVATDWIVYENNPVLHPSDLPADMQFADLTYHSGGFRSGTSVLYDEGMYKMWIAGSNNVDNKGRIGYATSPDGINWTFVRGNAGRGAVFQDGTSPHYHVLYPCVIKDGSTYKMWYNEDNNGHARYNYATSNDGIVWNEYGTILSYTDAGRLGFEGQQPGDASRAWVIKENDTTFSMWYSGYDGTTFRIGYATSTNGVNWTRVPGNCYGGSVLEPGESDKFDASHVLGPVVLKDGDIFRMWYYGQNVSSKIYSIGYATSPDGINWTKEYDPEGSGGRIEELGIAYYPTVIHDNAELKMWYAKNDGTTYSIHFARKIE